MPKVTCNLGIFDGEKVPEPLKALLRQTFNDYDEVIIDRVFTSGRSGAATYLVNFEPKEPPLVIKYLPAQQWQQEFDAYKWHIEGAKTRRFSQFTASILADRCCLSDDGLWGLLVYTIVAQGPLESADSLQEFFIKKGGAEAGQLLQNLFQRDGSLWWGDNRSEYLYVSLEYDRLLPVHLELKPLESVPADAQNIAAGVSGSQLAALRPGAKVIVDGFMVDEADDPKVNVSAPPGDAKAGPVRLRFVGMPQELSAQYQVGKPMPQQAAEVVQTRLGLLAEIANTLVPAECNPAQDEYLSIAGFKLHNPLPRLENLLNARYSVRFSLIHGDFNLENTRVPQGSSHGWLIDFAQMRTGPTLFDLQRLEVEVITHLLAPVVEQDADLDLQDALNLLRSLHAEEPPERAPTETLQPVYDFLKHVRRLVRDYLMKHTEWREYYHGLVLALLGSLKFRNLPTSTKQLAFAAAASAMTIKDTPLVSQASDTQLPGGGHPPYKGLAAYEEEDAAIYFGRNDLVQELLESVHELPTGKSPLYFFAIIGYSGSGKSSLLRAAVIPKLRTDPHSLYHLLPQSAIRPLSNPLRQLAAFVCQGDDASAIEKLIADMQPAHEESKHDAIQALDRYIARRMDNTGKRLLLPIDQFEELYSAPQEEIHAFVNNLLFAVGPEGHAAVVIACRSDFYTRFIATPNLAKALDGRTKNLSPLTEHDLENLGSMIQGPVQRRGLRLQPGFEELLLKDLQAAMRSRSWVQSTPAVLPLLSEVMRQTWEQRRGITLTLDGYYSTGGIQGVIARMADKVYDSLDEEEQRIAKRVLVQLANPGEAEGMGTKRRLELADLARSDERAQVEAVVDKLATERLLVSGLQSSSHINGVEIVHEALIREWPQLRQWMEEVREARRIQEMLAADVQSWEDSNRLNTSLLYDGEKRERAMQWAKGNQDDLVAPMPDFLVASLINDRIRNSTATDIVNLITDLNELQCDLKVAESQNLIRQLLKLELVNLARKPFERNNAGIALAGIGDQRPGVGLDADGLPDIAWCYVHEGEFIMGEEDNEHRVWVDSFAISKYPITVIQFRSYVEAVGSEEAGVEKDLEELPENHPVHIELYQALRFCEWLSQELSQQRGISLRILLPTEEQWEKAARGGLRIPVDPANSTLGDHDNPFPNRLYPWSKDKAICNEWQIADYCNILETGIVRTSTVGIFPNGQSPYGCQEMIGNIWEYTYPQTRQVIVSRNNSFVATASIENQSYTRGFSYRSLANQVHCTHPSLEWRLERVFDTNQPVGFRVVCLSPNCWPQ